LTQLSSVIVPNEASQSYTCACSNCQFVLPLNKAAPIFFERGFVSCSKCTGESIFGVSFAQSAIGRTWQSAHFGHPVISTVFMLPQPAFFSRHEIPLLLIHD
jgi:hypothetical protein